MKDVLGIAIAAVFLLLAAWHVLLASRTGDSGGGAVPTVDGKPLFVPTRQSTLAVAMVLCLCAGLVAATAGLIPAALPAGALRWLSFALALGLLARAVGDFRLVGFFKTLRGTRFATLDTVVYSPLCLALAAGIATIALQT